MLSNGQNSTAVKYKILSKTSKLSELNLKTYDFIEYFFMLSVANIFIIFIFITILLRHFLMQMSMQLLRQNCLGRGQCGADFGTL